MGVVIDVKDYEVKFIGMMTLRSIRERVKDLKEQGVEDITVNLRGKGIDLEYTKYLAEMKYDFGCKYIGEGNKWYEIEAYLMTGYFLKESMGTSKYVEWFKGVVETADYPLMLRDNRLNKQSLVPFNVIQPLKFDKRHFHFNVIKSQYLEPGDLERAIKNNEDVYTTETVWLEDIASGKEGFRFAGTERERVIIDIYEDILKGKVTGYMST